MSSPPFSSDKAGVYALPGRRSLVSSSPPAVAFSWQSASFTPLMDSVWSSRSTSPPNSRPSSSASSSSFSSSFSSSYSCSSASGLRRPSDAPIWERGKSLPAAPPAPLPPPKSSKPSFDDVQEGMVFFLSEPPKSSRMQVAIAGTGQDPWGHPFVVTGKRILDGEECVEVRCCTSFSERRITETQKRTSQHDLFVLADNDIDSVPHGNTRLAGLIVGSVKFPKRTYVNLSKTSIFEIEYQYLAAWKYGPIQFDMDAIQRIKAGRSS